MMTQPEQRIALAEWMGIVECNENAWTPLIAGASMIKSSHCSHAKCVPIGCFPDYPNDLNACHEVEKKLKEQSLCEKYGGTLGLLVEREEAKHECWEAHATTALMLYCFCTATSQQRTEALCRTLFPERFE